MEEDIVYESLQRSLRSLRKAQKLQPNMKLEPLIEQVELLIKEFANPDATVESIGAIQSKIEQLKQEKGWH